MADIEESSRLLENSTDYRTCSIAKNSKGYQPGNEYLPAHGDTLSDGDCRGRDPESEGASIGTNKDIQMRENLMAKNADGYTPGNEYLPAHQDTLSDGDCKGRDPESEGSSIGTNKDIQMRNCLMAKNADRYTCGNEYCAGVPDTVADGDCRGREPENTGEEAGTNKDMQMRKCLTAKNTPSISDDGWSGYNCGSQYCAGSDRV